MTVSDVLSKVVIDPQRRSKEREGSFAPLESLPDDVLSHVLHELDLPSMARLESVSKSMGSKVHGLGWPSYLLRHPTSHLTLHPTPSDWPAARLVRQNTFIERSLLQRRWHAVQVGQTWNQPAIPVLKVQPDRLVLGVGGKLVVHPLQPPSTGRDKGSKGRILGGRTIGPSKEYAIAKRDQGSGADVVGLVPLSDGQFGVGQYDGTLQRIALPDLEGYGRDGGRQARSTAHYPHPNGSNINTLAGVDDLMMSTTSAGLVSVFNSRSPWTPPSTFELPASTRAWSSLLTSPSSPLGFSAVIGTGQGISLYPLHPSGPSSPIALNADKAVRYLEGPNAPSASSAYSLTLPPCPSTGSDSITHHPSTLLSSWYDSHLRLHDLRAPSPRPIATFSDPYAWADGSAMYCATFLSDHWIAGGGARHGAVSLFDIRWPKKGWSTFSPGGKGSPVYALQGEGGRLWGVSEKRAFVLAFDGSADPVDHEWDAGELGASGSKGLYGEGLIDPQARARPKQVEERVSGWKGRGGKWSWTVRYRQEEMPAPRASTGREWDAGRVGQDGTVAHPVTASSDQRSPVPTDSSGKVIGEGVIGYDHADRSVNLFDSVPVPYPPLTSEPHPHHHAGSRGPTHARGGGSGSGGRGFSHRGLGRQRGSQHG